MMMGDFQLWWKNRKSAELRRQIVPKTMPLTKWTRHWRLLVCNHRCRMTGVRNL